MNEMTNADRRYLTEKAPVMMMRGIGVIRNENPFVCLFSRVCQFSVCCFLSGFLWKSLANNSADNQRHKRVSQSAMMNHRFFFFFP